MSDFLQCGAAQPYPQAGRPLGKEGGRRAQAGFTVFELLIAILMLSMVSTMIYSVLHTGIRFSRQGTDRILAIERRLGLESLLFQQINSAWFEPRTKNVVLAGDGDMLRLVTCYPLLYRHAGVVLAYYRYDPDTERLYYTEKLDYYNIDYDEEYLPGFEEMTVLVEAIHRVSFNVDPETLLATIEIGDTVFEVTPRCAEPAKEGI